MQTTELFIGPLIERNGGYCYQTFTLRDGLRTSFRYRRVEEARYDRRALIAESAANPRYAVRECETLAEFEEIVAKARTAAGDCASAPK
ncbi:MAG TPA: hypothetical protein VE993_20055 [Stellaceae bacterium]|nr:hypothetical protein [Stellaceae bacterium]